MSQGFLVNLSNKEPFSLNFETSTGISRIVWIKLTATFSFRLHAGESATEEEIKEFCKGQVCSTNVNLQCYFLTSILVTFLSCIFQIAHYKIPRYITFVDEFPLTVTGKVRT